MRVETRRNDVVPRWKGKRRVPGRVTPWTAWTRGVLLRGHPIQSPGPAHFEATETNPLRLRQDPLHREVVVSYSDPRLHSLQASYSLLACFRCWVKCGESFVLVRISCNRGENSLFLLSHARMSQLPTGRLQVHARKTLAQNRVTLVVELLRCRPSLRREELLPSIGLLAHLLRSRAGCCESGRPSARVVIQIRLE